MKLKTSVPEIRGFKTSVYKTNLTVCFRLEVNSRLNQMHL
jgi:hypothetical protein